MAFPYWTPEPKEAVRILAAGNRRHVKGRPKSSTLGDLRAIAAVVCPSGCGVSPEVLFDAAPGELFVAQGEYDDLIATLELAVSTLRMRLVVFLGECPARSEIELQLAPFGVRFVSGIVGPNRVVRFEPAIAEEETRQMCRSTKTV